MGYLFSILFAVGVHTLGEGGVGLGWRAPWVAPFLLPVPYVLGGAARRAAIAGRFGKASRIGRLQRASPLLLYFVLVAGLGWVDSVRAWTGAELALAGWPEPAILLSFSPFVVLQLLTIDAEARSVEPRPEARRRLRSFQVRMFASTLVPVAVYAVVAWLVGWNDVVRTNVERVEVWNAVFVTGVLVALGAFLPTLLARTWETVPMPPGPQRELCDAVAERADFHARDLLVWRTGNLMANAAVVGMSARRRVVLFSDSLLSLLSLRELASVFAHEIGHTKRHHVVIFVAWALAFFLGGDLVAEYAFPENEWAAGAAIVAALVLWYIGFGWLSRRAELEADLYSIELLHDPQGMISALERVGGRLRDVAGWRHFSTSDRVAFLLRAATDAGFARRFRRRLRLWSLTGITAALVVLGSQTVGLVRAWPVDRFTVELALGRYSSALERADGNDLFDEDDVEIARMAAGLEREVGRVPTADDLERSLGGALDRRELDRALGWAQLLVIRGRAEHWPLVDALELWIEGGAPAASAALEDVPAEWRARLLQ